MKYINIILIFIAVFAMMGTTQALKQPDEYDINQCELIMKDYRAQYGGNYVFILPHDERGVRDFSIPGHWINRAYSEDLGTYYIDYETQTYFQNVTEVSDWYRIQTGRRNSVYDYAVSRPGFGMQWNYPARSERT